MFGIDDIVGSGLKIVSQVIDRVFPDPEARDRAKLEMMKLQQEGAFKELDAELQMALAQAATNTEEAKSTNSFVAGWRPFVGWVAGTALALQFVIYPIVTWCFAIWLPDYKTPPTIPADLILTLVFGMLGLGTARTWERVKGVIPPGK